MAGCQKKATDDNAIRDAINKHLLSIGTLNLQAMEMDVTQTTIQDDHATAQVTFRPKTGAPTGAAMQVSYQLEKRDGTWSVLKTAAAGGMIEHPAPGTNPHEQPAQGPVHNGLPNFQDILGSPNLGANPSLPPGHPAVAPGQPPPQQAQSPAPQSSQPYPSQP